MTVATAIRARGLPGPGRRARRRTTPWSPTTPTRRWFATGAATRDEVRHLTVQFSRVQPPLRRGAAPQGDQRRRPRDLPGRQGDPAERARASCSTPAAAGRREGADPDLVATEGTVDGGRFRFAAAHFEWLLRFAAPLGLGFDDLGKRRHGTAVHPVLLRRAARASTARRTRRRPRARATPWSTGPPPGSGRSSSPGWRPSRRGSAASCRSPSGPGTTRSRTSTPPTPPTSWPRPSRSRGSTRTGSSAARPGCSTA